MKHRCECGKPAIGLARFRKGSCRATRAGRAVARKGHEMCPGCYAKWCDKYRKCLRSPEEDDAIKNMTDAELDAIEAEQRKPENKPAWFDADTERYGRLDAEGEREPTARTRGRGMCVVLTTLRN